MTEYVWVTLLLPLGVAMLCGQGSLLSPRFAALTGCVAAGGALTVSWGVFWEVLLLPEAERAADLVLWPWFACGELTAPVGLFIDPLASSFLLLVCIIAFLAHCYCAARGEEDEPCPRLIACLALSWFFMLVVVLADNFLLLLLGWEGLGVCTSLLVGFCCRNKDHVSAGGRIFVSGKVADYGLVLALLLIAVTFKRLDCSGVLATATEALTRGGLVATMVTLLLVVAACGKAAQLPFRVWLAHTGEVPMPGFALLCGATGVGAGAYLLMRCGPLFDLAPLSLEVLAVLGAASTVWSAAVASTQSDLRRLLAYLTASQLGFVFLAAGNGAWNAAMLQLMVQALCISLLVLAAENVRIALAGATTILTMGGLRKGLPWTFGCVLIAALSLAGVPPFGGFLSKSLVLQAAAHKGPVFLAAGALASLLTAFCLFRMVCVVFVGQCASVAPLLRTPGEESLRVIVLVGIAVIATVAGWVALPVSWGGTTWLEQFFTCGLPAGAASAAQDRMVATVGLGTALLGIGAAQVLYVRRRELPSLMVNKLSGLHRFFLNGWYLEALYDMLVVQPLEHCAKRLRESVDERLVERMFCGMAQLCLRAADKAKPVHDLATRCWALMILAGIAVLVGYCLWQ